MYSIQNDNPVYRTVGTASEADGGISAERMTDYDELIGVAKRVRAGAIIPRRDDLHPIPRPQLLGHRRPLADRAAGDIQPGD